MKETKGRHVEKYTENLLQPEAGLEEAGGGEGWRCARRRGEKVMRVKHYLYICDRGFKFEDACLLEAPFK